MFVASFKHPVMFESNRQNFFCNAGERTIFESDLFEAFPHDYFHDFKDLGEYLPAFKPPKRWKDKRVLIFKRGGYGDQLIASALLRYLKSIGAQAFACCSQAGDYMDLWGQAFGIPLMLPLGLDAVWRENGKPFFDIALFLEFIYETDTRPDQPNCYDQLFAAAGFDPLQIPDEYKRPRYTPIPQALKLSKIWKERISEEEHLDFGNGYIYFQPFAFDPTRSIPSDGIKAVLDGAQECGVPILVGNQKAFAPEIADLIANCPLAVNVATEIPSFSTFAAVISEAKAVICPDSAGMHLAAAMDIPSVSIFGAYDPNCRNLYYPRNVSIWHPRMCPKAPCYRVKRDTLPTELCPEGENQKTCACFGGITPEEVAKALAFALDLSD